MEVGPEADKSGLWVQAPPPVTLMTVEALQSYYWQRTIYFYNNDSSALVPDLRYLPMEVQRPYVPTKLLGWLAKGPSSSLDGVAQPLPGGSAPDGTAPLDGSTLTVSWTEVADPNQRNRIVNQVVWSLREIGFTQLVFRVGGESFTYDDAVINAGAAYPISDNPQRYAIDNGVVHRLVRLDRGAAGDAAGAGGQPRRDQRRVHQHHADPGGGGRLHRQRSGAAGRPGLQHRPGTGHGRPAAPGQPDAAPFRAAGLAVPPGRRRPRRGRRQTAQVHRRRAAPTRSRCRASRAR